MKNRESLQKCSDNQMKDLNLTLTIIKNYHFRGKIKIAHFLNKMTNNLMAIDNKLSKNKWCMKDYRQQMLNHK